MGIDEEFLDGYQCMYAAMIGSPLQGHQTHGDLDYGDLVLDAPGTRWAGDSELGSGDYNAPDYFDSEVQRRRGGCTTGSGQRVKTLFW